MATEQQIEANRQNALKSTGPRTPEGREASSQNALKHGLCAKKNVIKTENQDEFDIFRDNMLADLSPVGAMEEMLAERIVSLSWRLKRAEHFQNAVVDALIEHGLHGASSGFGWNSENRERAQKEALAGDMDVLLGIVINHDFANAKTLGQLLVYERRIESSLYRTIAELKKARRKKNTENRTQETVVCDSGLAARDSTSDGEGWHPQAQLGDGLEIACHPHPEKGIQDEDATQDCSNEPNLEDTCDSGLVARDSSSDSDGWHPQAQLGDGLEIACHPHPEKGIQDEDATQDC